MNQFLVHNYHTHTFRCKHATGTEREYIEAAIEMGMKTLGFSDHAPSTCMESFVPDIRMGWNEIEDYVTTLRTLSEEYKNQIKILIGLEAEYSKKYFAEQKKLVSDWGLDYMIIGQHFLIDDQGHVMGISCTDDREKLHVYMETLLEGMHTGLYSYIAHPDFVEFVGSMQDYEKECISFCEQAKKADIILEMNMLGMNEKRRYPNSKFWEIAGAVGNKVILGIDAHAEGQIKNRAPYLQCMKWVEKYHLQLVDRIADRIGEKNENI